LASHGSSIVLQGTIRMLQCHLAQGKAAHPGRFPGGNVFAYVIWFEFSSGLGALVQEPWQKCKIQNPRHKIQNGASGGYSEAKFDKGR